MRYVSYPLESCTVDRNKLIEIIKHYTRHIIFNPKPKTDLRTSWPTCLENTETTEVTHKIQTRADMKSVKDEPLIGTDIEVISWRVASNLQSRTGPDRSKTIKSKGSDLSLKPKSDPNAPSTPVQQLLTEQPVAMPGEAADGWEVEVYKHTQQQC